MRVVTVRCLYPHTPCTPRTGEYLHLTVQELRVVRASLLLAMDGDASEWNRLSGDDRDLAANLLDAIPDLTSVVGDASHTGYD